MDIFKKLLFLDKYFFGETLFGTNKEQYTIPKGYFKRKIATCKVQKRHQIPGSV